MTLNGTRIRQGLLLAGSALAIGWAAPAAAQDATAAQAATDQAAPASDELVVTARRREENLKDVPIAVSALSAQRLENLGAQDITTLQFVTPNSTIQVARGSNSTLIAFIRGVGQQDPLWGFDPGVGLYVDDVYFARPQAAVLDVYDVARIEVLRGPQGTLYGRNTIGGAIKYVTNPIGNTSELKARAEYGSYNEQNYLLSLKTPIIADKLAGGVTIGRFSHDGYGENLSDGADQYNKDIWAARGTLEATPTDNTFFRLSADITRDDSNARHGHREVTYVNPVTGATYPGADVLDNVYDTRAGIGDYNHVEARGGSFLAQIKASDALTFKSISAYRAGETRTVIDFDGTPTSYLDVPARYADHQFTQELQAVFNTDRVQGVAGLYYLNSTAAGAFDTIVSNLGLAIADAGHVDTRSYAAYVDANINITDRLSLDLGARYTKDEKTAATYRAYYLGAYKTPILGGINRPVFATRTNYADNQRDFEKFTPRASLSYKVTDDLTGYLSFSQGFKSGGFDMRGDAVLYPDTVKGYKPESVTSYEAGLKGSLFDRRLNFSSDVFYAKYHDVQITTQYATAAGIASVVDNVGQATLWGVEFEGNARITDHLRADASLGYINTKFDEYLGFIPGAPGNGQTCAPNASTPPSAAGCIVDLSSQRDVQNTPDWTGAASFTYTVDLAGGQLAITPRASYRGKSQMFETASAVDQGSYWLFDANILWNAPGGHWTLGLHGRNLGDERYRTGGYTFPGAVYGNSITAFYGPPRTFSASIEARF